MSVNRGLLTTQFSPTVRFVVCNKGAVPKAIFENLHVPNSPIPFMDWLVRGLEKKRLDDCQF